MNKSSDVICKRNLSKLLQLRFTFIRIFNALKNFKNYHFKIAVILLQVFKRYITHKNTLNKN